MRPSTIRNLGLDLATAIDKDGKLNPGFAIEAAPLWLWLGPSISLKKWRDDYGSRLASRLTVSAATISDQSTTPSAWPRAWSSDMGRRGSALGPGAGALRLQRAGAQHGAGRPAGQRARGGGGEYAGDSVVGAAGERQGCGGEAGRRGDRQPGHPEVQGRQPGPVHERLGLRGGGLRAGGQQDRPGQGGQPLRVRCLGHGGSLPGRREDAKSGRILHAWGQSITTVHVNRDVVNNVDRLSVGERIRFGDQNFGAALDAAWTPNFDSAGFKPAAVTVQGTLEVKINPKLWVAARTGGQIGPDITGPSLFASLNLKVLFGDKPTLEPVTMPK